MEKTKLYYQDNKAIVQLGADAGEWIHKLPVMAAEILEKGSEKVAVDFQKVEYIKSHGLSTLITMYHQLTTGYNPIPFYLCNLDNNQRSHMLFKATNIEKIPGMHKSSLEDFLK